MSLFPVKPHRHLAKLNKLRKGPGRTEARWCVRLLGCARCLKKIGEDRVVLGNIATNAWWLEEKPFLLKQQQPQDVKKENMSSIVFSSVKSIDWIPSNYVIWHLFTTKIHVEDPGFGINNCNPKQIPFAGQTWNLKLNYELFRSWVAKTLVHSGYIVYSFLWRLQNLDITRE